MSKMSTTLRLKLKEMETVEVCQFGAAKTGHELKNDRLKHRVCKLYFD